MKSFGRSGSIAWQNRFMVSTSQIAFKGMRRIRNVCTLATLIDSVFVYSRVFTSRTNLRDGWRKLM